MPRQMKLSSSKTRLIRKMRALAPLSVAGALALWGCAPSSEQEKASLSSSSDAVTAEASLEGLPLASLVQLEGYQLFEILDEPPLAGRLQRLLGPSLPRLQGNPYRLKVEGGMLTALPSAEEVNWCNASVFWADVRADRIQVWVSMGTELRSFSEGAPAPPPPAVAEAVEAMRVHVAQDCSGPEYSAAPWTAEGKCASTFGISSDKVYLFGSLHQGYAGPAALLDLNQSGRYMTGFPKENLILRLKPSGELVYSNGETLRLFVPDPQVRDLQGKPGQLAGAPGCYSLESPEANDIEIQTEGCESSGGLGNFWVRADDGAVIYNCQYGREEGHYFVVGGGRISLPAQSEQPLAFGYANTVLYAGSSGLILGDTRGSADPHEIRIDQNLRPRGPVRVTEDGYLIALLTGTEKQPPSLWKVSLNGQISRVADYPSPPPGLSFVVGSWDRSRLESDGTLWASTHGEVDAVVAFAPGGASRVAYRIQSSPVPPVVSLSELVAAP